MATELKVADNLVPIAVTAVIITTATRAAIRPYSMAVAPSSVFIKRDIRLRIVSSLRNGKVVGLYVRHRIREIL